MKIILLILVPFSCFSQMFVEEEAQIMWSNYSSVDLGNGNYVSLPHSGAEINQDTAFSISFWVKPIVGAATVTLFSKGTGDNQTKIEVKSNDNNYPYLELKMGDTNNFLYSVDALNDTTTNRLAHEFFHHIVFTYDGSNSVNGFECYVNAILQEHGARSTAGTPSVSTTDSIFIAYNGTTTYEIGYTAFRFFQTELSPGDISNLYNNGVPSYNSSFHEIEHTVLRNFSNGAIKGSLTTSDIKSENTFESNIPKHRYFIGSDNTVSIHAYNIFGGKAAFDYPNEYTSPVPYVWDNPTAYYDTANNVTYLATLNRESTFFARRSSFFKVDHSSNSVTHLGEHQSPTKSRSPDPHEIMVLMKAPGQDSFLIAYKEGNPKRGYIAKGQIYDFDHQYIGSVSYMNLFDLGNKTACFFKEGLSTLSVITSTDTGQNWSSLDQIGSISGNWVYPFFDYDQDTTYFFALHRVGSTPYNFIGISVIKTPDLVNFYALDGTSVGVLGSDLVTDAEFNGVCLVEKSLDNNEKLELLGSEIDTSGNLNFVYYKESTDSLVFARHSGGTLSLTNIDIVTNENAYFESGALVYKGGNSFDLFKIQSRNGFDTVVKYSTTDNFATVDSGTTVGNPDRNYDFIKKTKNNCLGCPVVIMATEVLNNDTEQTSLWVYEYTP